MKYLVVILLLAVVAVAQTYTTNFPLTENPISEGGKWVNGGTTGLDWNNIYTVPALARGDSVGRVPYSDATALLTGPWAADQGAQGTVYVSTTPRSSCYPEVELHLRGAIAAHVQTGYEISFAVDASSSAYLIIVRWNGARGNFTYLLNKSGSQYGVQNGDVVMATIIGNVISAYKNGVLMGTATDSTFATGSPGMGFNTEDLSGSCVGTNADYGYTSYTAVALGSPGSSGSSFVQANSGPSTIQSSNSSVAVSYLNRQTAGNLNIVVAGWGDNTSSISSVTDTQGNTYIPAVGPTSTTGLQQTIYYAKNIIGGSNKVTVKFNQAARYPDIRILEYTGLDPSSPLDVTAAGTGTGTTVNSGSATTNYANELILGAGTTGTTFSAAGSGFSRRIVNMYGNLAEDKTVSSTGRYTATATTSSAYWVMQMATFKFAGTAPVSPTQHQVDLSWNPSTSANITNYNVYRSTISGSSYVLRGKTGGALSYTDQTVQSGATYYYVMTAVDNQGRESSYSNQAVAVVPSP